MISDIDGKAIVKDTNDDTLTDVKLRDKSQTILE